MPYNFFSHLASYHKRNVWYYINKNIFILNTYSQDESFTIDLAIEAHKTRSEAQGEMNAVYNG